MLTPIISGLCTDILLRAEGDIIYFGRTKSPKKEATIKYNDAVLKGTVHGKTIELEHDLGFPDGQTVAVTLVPSAPARYDLRKAFGSWANDAPELDDFLEQIRSDRKRERNSIIP